MKNQRIPTGIPELDRIIEGGLRIGKSYLVIGEPGTGKTVFALQFLVNGLMNKEKGLYVAIDEKPADVMEQAKSLGWDLAPFIDSKDFLILDASAYFGARAAEGQARSIDVQRVVTDLSNYISRLGASRVAIDPLAPLLLFRVTVSGVLNKTLLFFQGRQANPGTTILLTIYAIEGQIGAIKEYLVPATLFEEM